jgi:AraC-like DNA-binding protein
MVEREVGWLTETLDHDLLDQARCSIALLLPRGTPALAAVSRRLGIGERTLQRRLKERGTSLRGLVDEVRRELAVRHLESDRLAIGEIAYLLGYADPPAFAHAFKRWTGRSPSEARRRDRDSG